MFTIIIILANKIEVFVDRDILSNNATILNTSIISVFRNMPTISLHLGMIRVKALPVLIINSQNILSCPTSDFETGIKQNTTV